MLSVVEISPKSVQVSVGLEKGKTGVLRAFNSEFRVVREEKHVKVEQLSGRDIFSVECGTYGNCSVVIELDGENHVLNVAEDCKEVTCIMGLKPHKNVGLSTLLYHTRIGSDVVIKYLNKSEKVHSLLLRLASPLLALRLKDDLLDLTDLSEAEYAIPTLLRYMYLLKN